MSGPAKRYIITVILLLIIALIAYRVYSIADPSPFLYTQNIPMIIGNWYGVDMNVDERVYDILETKDVIMREYIKSENERVILTVVFSQSNRRVTHPPEVCFAGGGWSQVDKDTQRVSVDGQKLEFNRLILQKEDHRQIVLYLYKAGDKLTNNYYVQQLNVIKNNMLHKRATNGLISISSFTNDDIQKSTDLMREFAREITPLIGN